MIRVVFALLRGLLVKLRYAWFRPNTIIGPDFRAYTFIRIKGPGKVIIGKKVSMDYVFLRNPTIITHTKDAVVRIGDGCYLGGIRISCVDSVTIGSENHMGGTTVMDSDIIPHQYIRMDEHWKKMHVRPVAIGSYVWTGINSYVLRGSTLHDEVVLGSGSVVREKEVPERTLMVGNPARKIGRTRE